MTRLISFAADVFNDACDICDRMPNPASSDPNELYNFLQIFMGKIKAMRPGDVIIVPVIWKINEVEDHAAILLLRRSFDGNDKDFCVSVINNRKGAGLDYHPCDVNTVDGSFNYSISMEFKGVHQAKVLSTTFW
jgi:hypothetical protein